jgi:hypothetical protein
MVSQMRQDSRPTWRMTLNEAEILQHSSYISPACASAPPPKQVRRVHLFRVADAGRACAGFSVKGHGGRTLGGREPSSCNSSSSSSVLISWAIFSDD